VHDPILVLRSDTPIEPQPALRLRCGYVGVLAFIIVLSLSGCAVVYHDSRSGAVHLWGIGHMAMRATVPNGGKKAVVQGVGTCGVSTGVWNEAAFITIGWNRQQVVEIVDENTHIQLNGPSSDLLDISVSGAGAAKNYSEGEHEAD